MPADLKHSVENSGENDQAEGVATRDSLKLPTEHFLQPLLDSLTSRIVLINEAGDIIAANRAWQDAGATVGTFFDGLGIGDNYLRALNSFKGSFPRGNEFPVEGIQAVLGGRQEHFELVVPETTSAPGSYFKIEASLLHFEGKRFATISHTTIDHPITEQTAAAIWPLRSPNV